MSNTSGKSPDFQALFEAAPTPFLVLNPDAEFTIAAVNPAYLRVTRTTSEQIVGRPLFEVFPDNPDQLDATGKANLKASLHRVLATRTTDLMAVQRYDIPRPEGGFEERHWLPVNAPMLSEDGTVVHIIHHVKDVTQSVRLQQEGVAQKRVEEALRESSKWFSTTLNSIGDAVIATDAAGQVTFMNAVAEEMTGWTASAAKGKPLDEVFVIVNETTRAPVFNPVEKVLAIGKTQGLANHTVLIAKDGRERPIDDSAAPIKNDEGRLTGVVLVFRDITERKQAEAELRRLREEERAADDRANRILESITDAFFSLDEEWRFTYLNPQAEITLGMPRGELLGRSLWEVYPGTVGSEFEHAYRRVIADGVARSFSAHFPDHDRWYEVHAYPTPGGLSVYFRDASERMRAEAERERIAEQSEKDRRMYHAALSNTPDLAYVFDLDHRFIYANEALLAMWGRTWDEAIGKSCWELGYEPWHAEMHDREIDQVIETRRPIRGEVPFKGTNGRRVYDYIFTPVLSLDGSVQAVAGTTRDVTDRKRYEEELKENDRRKDEFLAMLAHELRNPLAAVGNAVTVLKLSDDEDNTNFAKNVIERQVRQLSHLIDDLLDVSRITSGKIRLRKEIVDAGSILEQAVDAVRPLVSERNQQLFTSFTRGELAVEADPTRLEQVMLNLLTNAAKYTESGGNIWLSARQQHNQVVVRVRDDGIGIPPEKLPEMFVLFAQGERSIARSEGGLGIGLTIVKQLVEMHGGSVSATSDGPGKGSEFVVSLPAARISSATPTPSTPPTRGKRGSRILVVDDNVDTARGMARLMKLLGNEVETAHEGLEALAKTREFRPEFVLLDVGLPGMDGYEVAARLRAASGRPEPVIIGISGYGQDEDRRRSKAAGFDHYLVKPIDHDALISLLSNAPNAPTWE